MNKIVKFNNTFSYKVIYIFKIYDEIHKGILKIGETTLKTDLPFEKLIDNCDELNKSAKNRIKQYTNTIGVQEDLLYTTLAIDNKNKVFKDKDVHRVLKNSGINKYKFNNEKNPGEWFEVNLDTAINAINATKECRPSLNQTDVLNNHEDIEFRPEQIQAIEQTISRFKVSDRMLWNAKMRFGKTLSTLEVIKRMSKNDTFKLSKVIILTHRPVVDDGWFEDYTKIFYNNSEFLYGSKRKTTIKELIKSNKKFIYFASIQDLRGSDIAGGKFDKNNEVFDIDWDLVVIDEAHEGTQTELGNNVIREITKTKGNKITKQLFLSGTPFNLISDFESKDIYTWDYIMEQKAKSDWNINHPFETNPYEDLPKMNIMTYNLESFLPNYIEVADKAFNFREFFRVWTGESEKDGKELEDINKIGKFVHEIDVEKFLNLITKKDDNNNYPFSKPEYIENFRHSFWVLPGVKEAKALKELMMKNEVFSLFNIVNVAGTGDDNGDEALDAVNNAIGDKPEDTYTITLSCGKLTTGVTVKAWSAVLYLAGSFSTSASSYLQTIFRVQSPANYGGKQKTDCYVFDFAPDRTLKMVAQAGDLSTKVGNTGSQELMKQFLNFCPVISINGSNMIPYDVSSMLQQLKQAYIERVVDNGFDDSKIYNDNLLKLDELELKKFDDLKGIIGSTKQKKKINEIDVNKQGFTEEEWKEIEKAKKKQKRELTEEQKTLLEEIREKNNQRNDAISILRGISIRIPLLIYGADIDENVDITSENFVSIVDDISWIEFMPKGVTKEKFKDFAKYYDNEVFIGAGRRIRNISKYADTLSPIERAKAIADIFSTFRNPDKETVLTPWKTVNMHMGDTLGGYNFFDKEYLISIEEPRLINNGDVTHDVLFNEDSKILELNSKTGLYPLYVTISLFKQRCLNMDSKKLTEEVMESLWNRTVEENIYVVCKTPMARSITKRTLIGYKKNNTNILIIENIIEKITTDIDILTKLIKNPKTWNKNGGELMKFDAVIGNPPYQLEGGSGGNNDAPIYQNFAKLADYLNPNYISLIMPARWFAAGRENLLGDFRKKMLANKNVSKLYVYTQSKNVFPNVEIKGGICYFLINKNYKGDCEYKINDDGEVELFNRNLNDFDVLIRDPFYSRIVKKVFDSISNDCNTVDTIISNDTPFGISSNVRNSKKNFIQVFSESNVQHDTLLYHIENLNRKIEYVNRKDIVKHAEDIDLIKVFIPGAGGSGNDPYVLGKPEYAPINSVCSQSYLYAKFNTEEEAKNFIKYLNTKFFRSLVASIKISQSAPNKVYRFVPLQNFTNNSDINWNTNIDMIDEQLYQKYNISVEEVDYINTKLKYSNDNYFDNSCINVYIKRDNKIIASGTYKNGKILVLKGSLIIDKIKTLTLRKMVLKERNSEDIKNNLFVNDHIYDTPSRASTVILGQNSNGYSEWKNIDGIPLNNILKRK